MKPQVVVVLCSAFPTNGLFFRSLDIDSECALGEKLVERLRAFGYEKFSFVLLDYLPPWMDRARHDAEVESLKRFANAHGGRIAIARQNESDSSLTDMVRRSFAEIESKLECAEDEPILKVLTDCVFIPEKSLSELTAPLSAETMMTYWNGSFALERPNGMTRKAFRFVAETGTMPHGASVKTIAAPKMDDPLPYVKHFSTLTEFKPVYASLSESHPSTWSYSSLSDLYATKPGLFRGALRHLGVELTNADNLPRLRRPSAISSRAIAHLSAENWAAILESMKAELQYAPVSLDFWDFGEPLLHANAVEMIEQSARAGIRTDLYTNGTLVTPAIAERLCGCGCDAVFVRLDAATPETYAAVCGDAACFSKAQSGLSALGEAKKRTKQSAVPWKPILAVQITEMKETEKDWDAFFETYGYLDKSREKLLKEKGAHPSDHEALQAMYREHPPFEYAMLRHDHIYCGKVTRNGGMDVTPLHRFSCRQLREGLYVLANGDVVPCREDVDAGMKLGAAGDGVAALWRSPACEARHAEQYASTWNENPLCSQCKEWYCTFI